MINSYAVSLDSNKFVLPLPKIEKAGSQINAAAQKSFSRFEKVWSYAGKSLLTTRHMMNITLRSCRWIALSCRDKASLRNIVLHLKIFSIVSVPLNLTSLPAACTKVWNNIKWGDRQGIGLSTFSFTILAADTFDSLTTFVNATLQIASRPVIGWMSSLGMPLAFTIISLGSVIRIVKLKDISSLIRDIDGRLLKKLSEKDLDEAQLKILLKEFLAEKLGAENLSLQASPEVLKEAKRHKIAVLERQGNSKISAALTKLAHMLEGDEPINQDQKTQLVEILESTVQILNRERKIQGALLFANIISASALTLFSVPNAPVLPFILLAASMLTRLGAQAFQDFS